MWPPRSSLRATPPRSNSAWSLRSPTPGQPRAPAPQPLSVEFGYWLDEVTRLRESDSEDYPAGIRQRLVYLLDVKHHPRAEPRLLVSPVSARLLKDGSFSPDLRPYNPASALSAAPAKFLRPSDRSILRRLEGRNWPTAFGDSHTARTLRGEEGTVILEAILATGRAYWKAHSGPTVRQGPSRRARFHWQLGGDAAQRLTLDVDGGRPLQVVSLAPPWYVDESDALLGPLETGLGPRLAEALLALPPVPPGQETPLRTALKSRLPDLIALQPPELPPAETPAVPPIPRLVLTTGAPSPPPAWAWTRVAYNQPAVAPPVARLSFRYGPAEVTRADRHPRLTLAHDGRVINVARDLRAERLAEARLRGLGFGARALRSTRTGRSIRAAT